MVYVLEADKKTTVMPALEAEGMERRGRQQAHQQCAACRIQSVFRGWRTRKRVVWAVRAELEALMEQMEADVEMERLLLALPKPQVHGCPCAGGASLRLPRIQDDVFEWRSSFPEDPRRAKDANAATESIATEHSEQDEDGEKVNDTDCGAVLREAGEASVLFLAVPSMVSSDDEEEEHDEAQEADTLAANIVPLPPGEPRIDEQDEPSQAEKKHDERIELEVGPVLSGARTSSRTNDADPPLTIDHILATHSKTEIKLEVAWARQALRDRLRYLRNCHRAPRS